MPDYELIAGVVGEGAAAEFCGFMGIYRDLPDPQALLNDPDNAEVPQDPAMLYAICELLSEKAEMHNLSPIMAYARRLPPEFSVLLVRDAARANKAIVETSAFNEWAVAHADVLL